MNDLLTAAVMRAIRDALLVASLFALAIVPSAAFAKENRAAARAQAMAAFLAKAQRLSVTVDCAYDVLQSSGEKIEFGERREVVLRRPDRARIDIAPRDGARRGLVFDGKELTVFDATEKVYATVAKPGTVDAAFDYFVNELRMRLPLRELLQTDFPKRFHDVLASARLVGEEQLGGVTTEHVACRGDNVDVQLWIPRDGDPLPKRIVITYRLAGGQPRFEANFSAWNLAPDVPDSLFTYMPAAGEEKIPIVAPGQAQERKP